MFGINRPLPAVGKESSLGENRSLYSHRKRRWKQADEDTSSDDFDMFKNVPGGKNMRGPGYSSPGPHAISTPHMDVDDDYPIAPSGTPERAAEYSLPGSHSADYLSTTVQSPAFAGPSTREQASENASDDRIVEHITEYRCKKNRELTKAALNPNTSFARFKEQLSTSSMPESLKERFRSMQ